MQQPFSSKRFLRLLAFAFAVICGATALVNYAVDPYGMFATPRVAGFNARKPAAGERVRVAKPYLVSAAVAHTVIAGNSRVEMGIDPQSACWRDNDRPVFNMGIPGVSFESQTEYARHALLETGARQVLFGVDLLDFLVDTTRATPAADAEISDAELRLNLAAARASALRVFALRTEDRLKGLFSLEALGDSLYTLSQQGDANASDRRADGFNPARDYVPIIRSEGQDVLFKQKNRSVAAMFALAELGLVPADATTSSPLQALEDFLAWAAAHDVTPLLFINAYHADYLGLIALSDKWPLFEQWKRDVLAMAQRHGVALWDFSRVDDYSSEVLPAEAGRGKTLKWFWEPAHYRRELGERMLAVMRDSDCVADAVPLPGVLLDPGHIDAYLAQEHEAITAYLAGHPERARALSNLLQQAR